MHLKRKFVHSLPGGYGVLDRDMRTIEDQGIKLDKEDWNYHERCERRRMFIFGVGFGGT